MPLPESIVMTVRGKIRAAVLPAPPPVSNWQLVNPANNQEIEGWAEVSSVNTGDSFNIYVNVTDGSPTYDIEIWRMGGIPTRYRVISGLTSHAQTIPAPDPTTLLMECVWANPVSVSTVGIPSGPVLLKLTASSGKQRYIFVVVRDDSSTAKHLMQCGVLTGQAYSEWPNKTDGYCLYTLPNKATMVSLNRPSDNGHPYWDGYGAGQFLQWEFPFIQWAEQNGYQLSYVTDLDIHIDPTIPQKYKGWHIVGHQEYWSNEMRQSFIDAVALGTNVCFWSANTMYWQIRMQADSAARPYRTIVCYKSTNDPGAATDLDITCQFRTAFGTRPARPEWRLESGEYVNGKPEPQTQNLVAYDITAWPFAGVGASTGTVLGRFVGYECDMVAGATSQSTAIHLLQNQFGSSAKLLCYSVFNYAAGGTRIQTSAMYQAPSGAYVIDWGCVNIAWGLSSGGTSAVSDEPYHTYSFDEATNNGRSQTSAMVQAIAKNVFDTFQA